MSRIESTEVARALPEKPSLENLKKQARQLLRELRAGQRRALDRVRRRRPKSARLDAGEFTLADAQRVIARECGFASWPKLKAHVEAERSRRAANDPADARAALVERLYRALERLARGDEWLSRPTLSRLAQRRDLPRLIAVAARACDTDTGEGSEPSAVVARLCEALDRLAVERRPEALGRSSAAALERSNAGACVVVLQAEAHPHLAGRRYFLDGSVTLIGRGEQNQIVLPSDEVSRQHARIERAGSDYVLCDRGSTNGTFVGEQPEPVERHVLADGDHFVLGDTILRFLIGGDLEAKYRDKSCFRLAS